ncbi:hypothetical protein PPL_03433 [Heterostelium album PN500]|uniref:Uncharacterized protein n=1 Tax=Heterostelium pallidum (strain ATCC 26659 / Pp 5 / PN500) TaxID=670386 RepID=D3B4V7_HETP5|nr:hypothetical protein PPL_03433 [Heterostelium album PN500]EFA84355.1 hypothetical protein PPL_03433 [Heterostelium album PN500]|eukprot:XP_020436470.1 hypothetical protein PPL_03433 [Heterostelium album PN500]
MSNHSKTTFIFKLSKADSCVAVPKFDGGSTDSSRPLVLLLGWVGVPPDDVAIATAGVAVSTVCMDVLLDARVKEDDSLILSKCFTESEHVAHYRKYPVQYTHQIDLLLDNIEHNNNNNNQKSSKLSIIVVNAGNVKNKVKSEIYSHHPDLINKQQKPTTNINSNSNKNNNKKNVNSNNNNKNNNIKIDSSICKNFPDLCSNDNDEESSPTNINTNTNNNIKERNQQNKDNKKDNNIDIKEDDYYDDNSNKDRDRIVNNVVIVGITLFMIMYSTISNLDVKNQENRSMDEKQVEMRAMPDEQQLIRTDLEDYLRQNEFLCIESELKLLYNAQQSSSSSSSSSPDDEITKRSRTVLALYHQGRNIQDRVNDYLYNSDNQIDQHQLQTDYIQFKQSSSEFKDELGDEFDSLEKSIKLASEENKIIGEIKKLIELGSDMNNDDIQESGKLLDTIDSKGLGSKTLRLSIDLKNLVRKNEKRYQEQTLLLEQLEQHQQQYQQQQLENSNNVKEENCSNDNEKSTIIVNTTNTNKTDNEDDDIEYISSNNSNNISNSYNNNRKKRYSQSNLSPEISSCNGVWYLSGLFDLHHGQYDRVATLIATLLSDATANTVAAQPIANHRSQSTLLYGVVVVCHCNHRIPHLPTQSEWLSNDDSANRRNMPVQRYHTTLYCIAIPPYHRQSCSPGSVVVEI